ncbi:MCE family protein [Mycobacterium koreense]|uniref:Mammalian cell entry protein n=1 Tax=Mycolicibacillus koreensis TaxID=1069220 RepID=A0A7I7SIW0_9MYCO|nr:MCE family protein [Mycolicibacillus koreensis]MCV7250504.1 MCE family protein [Mycolicibacillus koreensis]OSC32752.1 mammalian cell entry protein [Mycolicibacillus koreensis]BBY56371.1 mammalian cell entry protein [Mycolicibacillus koreensis]
MDRTLRTGIFGVVLVASLVLVSFSYTAIPFWPQGKNYVAYFTDASGISPGSDVQISGIKVGKVGSVSLAGANARVDFTVDRKLRIGDQSLAAIKTETVLGEKALAITPAGAGSVTTIPVGRTSTPYTLNTALQDLGANTKALDKKQLEQALGVLTDALAQATPHLRGALDGIAGLSRSLNKRDGALAELLSHAKSVTSALSERADQVTALVNDGNQLFAALDRRRQALAALIAGIDDVSTQLSGLVADNQSEFGPALSKLNLVLDNMLERKEHISEALRRLPGYATALGEVVGSGPGFQINLYGMPPATIAEVLLDAYFQPGKLPDSLSDYLRGMISERIVVRPRSP